MSQRQERQVIRPGEDLGNDAFEPEMLEPEILEHEVLKPDVLEPDVLKPDVLKPDVLKPDALESAAPLRAVEEEELTEFDLYVSPFQSRPSELDDPVAATPALRSEDPLREFSDNARKRYDLEVSTFAAELRRQSLVHKRSHGGDSVSGRDVTAAAVFLRSHRSPGFLNHLGVVGGVLVGLGAQRLGSMMEQGTYPTGGILWGAGTTVIGVALFVWHFARNRS